MFVIKERLMADLPKHYRNFIEDYPEVAKAYEALGDAVHTAGPLDSKSRALIKLAISIGARLEGAVHSHVRKALEAGCTPEEIRQVALLAIPTIGLPPSMAGLTWIEDILESAETGNP